MRARLTSRRRCRACTMGSPIVELRLDRTRPLAAQPGKGHNRWHPGIPPALRVAPGDEVVIDTTDAFDGQLSWTSSHEDVVRLDLYVAHPLSGPVFVDGAEPGDLLAVEIVDVVPAEFGWTSQAPGFGFLRDCFPEPFLVRWRLSGGFA